MKSVQIRSYFWSAFSYIQSEYRKTRTWNNSVFGQFARRLTTLQMVLNKDSSRLLRKKCFISYHQSCIFPEIYGYSLRFFKNNQSFHSIKILTQSFTSGKAVELMMIVFSGRKIFSLAQFARWIELRASGESQKQFSSK